MEEDEYILEVLKDLEEKRDKEFEINGKSERFYKFENQISVILLICAEAKRSDILESYYKSKQRG